LHLRQKYDFLSLGQRMTAWEKTVGQVSRMVLRGKMAAHSEAAISLLLLLLKIKPR
jgi:hypothetical protein